MRYRRPAALVAIAREQARARAAREARWPRRARRWLAAPSGLTRGGFLAVIGWVLVTPWIVALMEAHRSIAGPVTWWAMVSLAAALTARIIWLVVRRRGRHG
jgi:hypothetical protein